MSQLANAIRFLSVDAVQKANSGHPGAPMGMAEMAEVLWTKFLNHNPANPKFYNRDRFVLSNGHASMILYSLLHLTGYNVSIDDLKNFRQLHSKTPGHPEYGYTDGVETTTGPLGQGIANAVGMALAEKILAAEFNKDGLNIVDHHTYVFMGDGCMMEGVSHEACSLAGTLGLGKLIVLYDDNNISIDGKVDGWFTENIPQRFESYGWHVIPNVNGHDTDAIQTAIEAAKAETGKPSLICCKTLIGKGSANKEGSHKPTVRLWVRTRSKPRANIWVGLILRLKSLKKSMLHGMQKKKARNLRPNGTNSSLNIKPNILPKPQNLCAAWIKNCLKTSTLTFKPH